MCIAGDVVDEDDDETSSDSTTTTMDVSTCDTGTSVGSVLAASAVNKENYNPYVSAK